MCSLFEKSFRTISYVITSHQVHLSQMTKHWDSFVSHCSARAIKVSQKKDLLLSQCARSKIIVKSLKGSYYTTARLHFGLKIGKIVKKFKPFRQTPLPPLPQVMKQHPRYSLVGMKGKTKTPNTSQDLLPMAPLTRPQQKAAHKNESHKWDL